MTKQGPTRKRVRRTRADLRERLLDAALIEFAAHGFDGASTRAIAQRVGAHQPQINYHFASKEALWQAAIGHLFAQLALEMGTVDLVRLQGEELAAGFTRLLRRLVRFLAHHPELNRIMVHEATSAGPRLEWLTETWVRPYFAGLRPVWRRLRRDGVAADVDEKLVHHVLMGAASLPFVNAHELQLLVGIDVTRERWIERHADGLIALFLPGLNRSTD